MDCDLSRRAGSLGGLPPDRLSKAVPVVNNYSGGTISTQIQIRRLAYPSNEYITNAAAVNAAVSTLLNGPDNGGTRLWWDTGGSNF